MVTQHSQINELQSSAERSSKYALARTLNCSESQSRRMRDWPWHKIALYFGFKDFQELRQEKPHIFKNLTYQFGLDELTPG